MTTPKKGNKITVFTDILRNFNILKDSGLLTNERFQELTDYVSDDKFTEVRLDNGAVIDSWRRHEPSGEVFCNWETHKNSHYILSLCLEHILTDEEIALVNKCGDDVYRETKNRQMLEKAIKIDYQNYDGYFYAEGIGREYFNDLEDLEEECADYDIELPEYAFACESNKIVKLSFDDLYDRISDRAYEDFDGYDLTGVEELEAAIEKFNEANKDLICYNPDFTKVILWR